MEDDPVLGGDRYRRAIWPAELTFMATRAGARITDVNAGHLSPIADPGVVQPTEATS